MSGQKPWHIEQYITLGGEVFWWCGACQEWHRDSQRRQEQFNMGHVIDQNGDHFYWRQRPNRFEDGEEGIER